MPRSGALLLLVGGLACLFACDSGEDPLPVSTFPREDTFARRIGGRVLADTEPVEGAIVRVDASPGFGSDEQLAATSTLPRSAATDGAGLYRIGFAPFAYDLTVQRDLDVLVMRDVGARYVEPSISEQATPRGFHAAVVPTPVPAPAAGNAVAYFVSGGDARTVTRTADALDVTFRAFESVVTVHAVEYVPSAGLAGAVREGRAEVRLREGTSIATDILMLDVTSKAQVTFTGDVPEGFTLEPLELEADYGLRTSAQPLPKATVGVPFAMATVPGLLYTVRGRATRAGAVSRTGRVLFDPNAGSVALTFPPPVSGEEPIDDDVPPLGPATGGIDPVILETGGALAARFREGVLEHTLRRVGGGGPVIRVATVSRTTTLPDLARLGLPRPVGRYEWSIEHFPKLAHIEGLAGTDARLAPASYRSAPKVVVLR